MAITAKDVNELRKRTGQGMMECKQALVEADGDMEKAVELLRERAGGKMDERTAEAGEGAIAIATGDGAVAMVEVRSETDFAARNDQFLEKANQIAKAVLACDGEGDIEPTAEIQKLVDDLRITIKENISLGRACRITGPKVGSYVHTNNKIGAIIAVEGDFDDDLLKGLCQHIAAAVPPVCPAALAIDADGLPAALIDEQRVAFVAEAEASGKPREIAEKMTTGKLRKWTDENTLTGQIYIRELDARKPVREYLPQGGKILKFVRYQVGS